MSEPSKDRPKKKVAKPAGKRRRKVRRSLVKVDPQQLQTHQFSWLEEVKRDIKTLAKGFSVSAAFHAVLLLIMAAIVVSVQGIQPEDILEIGWLTPSEQQAETQKKPARIAPIKISKNTKPVPKKTEPTPETPPKTTGTATPVKPADVKNLLSGRSSDTRSASLSKVGNSRDIEQAIARGLGWLVRQQLSSGNWQLDVGGSNGRPKANYPDAGSSAIRTDTGATALALLALLGAGNSHQSGQFSEAVGKGIGWLTSHQKPNGDLHDFEEQGRRTAYYAHCQATIALCEALAMTGDEDIREPTEQAIKFLIDSQYATDGGWKYRPPNDRSLGDLSVTGWALMALNTARTAGIEIPESTFLDASDFLDTVQENNGSRYKYAAEDPADRISPAMTAEGILCRQWLGWPRDKPQMVSGVRFLLADENQPSWSAGRRNVYSWYYTAQVLHNLGGDDWQKWSQPLLSATIKGQTRTGSRKPGKDIVGSWHPRNPVGSPHEYADSAGRLYLTSMCLLILETPFRHRPLYAETSAEEQESRD